ncbi:YcbK family protein [Ursidibacter maritimus]|uniref:Murein endopeptidase K n=1 Tax=Ursidibacter maritimus TaxID=1331689 RepID=A0A949WMX7_9PAST|nr:YcbK family protein [Ursidibacter maritimus]KAE9540391.1 hypothetical protein A1D26_01520 [Ursidibacter maritimus]MBV6524079.1 YcbK family protein [Ursidibacter maritimus]MBV6526724.1 YcbK family protein [Ursidibacter maritimus]MBV6527179.1 YcbK family protein [Ursidibacter maritimus]MBV6529893.1 YcbK family protein [Ursidibacter maritimus]
MEKTNLQRRRWLSLGGIMLGASFLPNYVSAIVSTPKPLSLRLRNVNTGETLNASYSANGFSRNDLSKLNYIMRDRHTNQVRAIDPNLFLKLTRIQAKLGMRNSEILILSGYRSAQTNARMRRRSRGVASNSYHILGKAVDFYIPGVPLAKVKLAAESLHSGGVGYYPGSNFVHVDTGPVRTWRG